MRPAFLDADRLAFQPLRARIGRLVARGREECGRHAHIGLGKRDLLAPFIGDLERRHHRVILIGDEAGNHPVPVLRLKHADALHSGAKLAAKLDLEAGQFAAFEIIVWRPRALAGDAQSIGPLIGVRQGGQADDGGQRQFEDADAAGRHICSPDGGARTPAADRTREIDHFFVPSQALWSIAAHLG